MSSVQIVRKKGGEAKRNKKDQYVFTKEGVYFALDKEQMSQLKSLMDGILDGSLVKVEITKDDLVVED